jgi:hypothetical protein
LTKAENVDGSPHNLSLLDLGTVHVQLAAMEIRVMEKDQIELYLISGIAIKY